MSIHKQQFTATATTTTRKKKTQHSNNYDNRIVKITRSNNKGTTKFNNNFHYFPSFLASFSLFAISRTKNKNGMEWDEMEAEILPFKGIFLLKIKFFSL